MCGPRNSSKSWKWSPGPRFAANSDWTSVFASDSRRRSLASGSFRSEARLMFRLLSSAVILVPVSVVTPMPCSLLSSACSHPLPWPARSDETTWDWPKTASCHASRTSADPRCKRWSAWSTGRARGCSRRSMAARCQRRLRQLTVLSMRAGLLGLWNCGR